MLSIIQVRHLPSWFPGAKFHRTVQDARMVAEAMYNEPYKKAKNEIVRISGLFHYILWATSLKAAGSAAPSMLSKLLESYTNNGMDIVNETVIAQTSTVAYAGQSLLDDCCLVPILLSQLLWI